MRSDQSFGLEWPFSASAHTLTKPTSRNKKGPKKASHATRNILIFGLVVIVVVVAAALFSATSTYVVFVHAYDQSKGNPQTIEDLTIDMLVANVTVTIAGANPATRFTPTGIIAYDQLAPGSYQITITGQGYSPTTVAYSVGDNCAGRTPDGQCHALVPMTKTT